MIYLGADYKGFAKKNELIIFLNQIGYETTDKGAFNYIEGDDFNDPAIAVAKAVAKDPGSAGILICDSAHGVTMQANRFKHIRAAHCGSPESARLAREHDAANILCLSAHFLTAEEMHDTVVTFLTTEFEMLDRRVRRINRLDEREDYA